MSLPGSSVATSSVADVLLECAAERVSGCLAVSDAAGQQARVWLSQGDVDEIEVPGLRPMLGVRLLSTGVLTPEVLALALEEQRRRRQGARLDEVLVDLGVVSEEVVATFLLEQRADMLADLQSWQLVAVSFLDQVEEPAPARGRLGTAVAVSDLLTRAQQRAADPSDVVGLLGGPDVVPMLATSPAGVGDVVLGPSDWALLCKIDGHRSLRELAADCGFTVAEAASVLSVLHAAGLVDCGPDDTGFRFAPSAPDPWTQGLADVTAALGAVLARSAPLPDARPAPASTDGEASRATAPRLDPGASDTAALQHPRPMPHGATGVVLPRTGSRRGAPVPEAGHRPAARQPVSVPDRADDRTGTAEPAVPLAGRDAADPAPLAPVVALRPRRSDDAARPSDPPEPEPATGGAAPTPPERMRFESVSEPPPEPSPEPGVSALDPESADSPQVVPAPTESLAGPDGSHPAPALDSVPEPEDAHPLVSASSVSPSADSVPEPDDACPSADSVSERDAASPSADSVPEPDDASPSASPVSGPADVSVEVDGGAPPEVGPAESGQPAGAPETGVITTSPTSDQGIDTPAAGDGVASPTGGHAPDQRAAADTTEPSLASDLVSERDQPDPEASQQPRWSFLPADAGWEPVPESVTTTPGARSGNASDALAAAMDAALAASLAGDVGGAGAVVDVVDVGGVDGDGLGLPRSLHIAPAGSVALDPASPDPVAAGAPTAPSAAEGSPHPGTPAMSAAAPQTLPEPAPEPAPTLTTALSVPAVRPETASAPPPVQPPRRTAPLEPADTAALMRELSSLSALDPEPEEPRPRPASRPVAERESRKKRRGLFGR